MMQKLKDFLNSKEFIDTAILYGTRISCEANEDLDIAIILKSDYLIFEEFFRKLIFLRKDLVHAIGCDIDLIPHTLDELKCQSSPLYNPRYNPPIVFGKRIKGEIKINQPQDIKLNQSDISESYLSLDRTIIRRLICRDCSISDSNILFNKIQSLPINIINNLTLKSDLPFFDLEMEDFEKNLNILDLIYNNQEPDKFSKLALLLNKESFLKMKEIEQIEVKIALGKITEDIFKTFFTEEINLNKYILRIKYLIDTQKEKNKQGIWK